MGNILNVLSELWQTSGFFMMISDWRQLVMIVLACVLLYLGLVKQFEPLLLVGIAFGMLLTNLPGSEMYHPELWDRYIAGEITLTTIVHDGGLLDVLYIGVKAGLYPSLIFMGVGAMTDFGPLLANPKSLLLGAAAQLGIFAAFLLAIAIGFPGNVAAAIGIIGGADGPTAIWLTSKLAPDYLAPIAIAAYSYMALIPLIQPPLMRLLTTKEERECKMEQLRPVSKKQKRPVPHHRHHLCLPAAALCRAAARLPYAGQSVQGVRADRPSQRHGAERHDEHRHHFPLHLRRRNGALLPLPHAPDH